MEFIRRLFGGGETRLKNIELKEWLEETGSGILKNENKSIGEKLSAIRDLKTRISEDKTLLENAPMPEMDESEKRILQAARFSFAHRLSKFIDAINIPDLKYNDIEAFCSSYLKLSEEFNDENSKNFYSLSKHFPAAVSATGCIKDIEDASISLKNSLKNEKIAAFRALLSRIRELNEISMQGEATNAELGQLRAESDEIKEKISSLQAKLGTLKAGSEYYNYLKLEKEDKELSLKLDDLNKKTQRRKVQDVTESMLKKTDELQSRKRELEAIMERSSARFDIKEIEYQMQHQKEKEERLQEKINEKMKFLDDLEIDRKARRLEKALSEFTGKKVVIG